MLLHFVVISVFDRDNHQPDATASCSPASVAVVKLSHRWVPKKSLSGTVPDAWAPAGAAPISNTAVTSEANHRMSILPRIGRPQS
jgi:hypothetical protein